MYMLDTDIHIITGSGCAKCQRKEDAVRELAGSWKDDRSVEEMIDDMRLSRITNTRILESLDG